MKELTPAEIESFDGKDGRPVYIVHEGKVYDVSGSKLWREGFHMKRHHAGGDLTVDIQAAPHGTEVLERYPQIGIVQEGRALEPQMSECLVRLLERFPILRRHPHPMTVHFPIAFALSVTVFNLLYVISGVKSLETTAVHCLAAAILFMPVVMLTGLFTWWLNYLAKPMKAVTVKLVASLILYVDALTIFAWRMTDPSIVDSLSFSGILYFVLILLLAPVVGVIGWHGAQLTFPTE